MHFNTAPVSTSVTIGNGVTNVGSEAFYDTPWLEGKQSENPLVIVNNILIDGMTCEGDVEIPDSVTSIGDSAFYYCVYLTDITIPDSVTSIGDYAFYHCASLTNVTIPGSVTSIGSDAFYECKSLTSIIFFNPNCKIPDSSLTIWNEDYLYTGTIYDHDNSTAEAYAETYGYIFISLGTPLSLADLDGDNEITVQDAYLYQCAFANAAAGNGDGLTDTQRIAADVDGDGEITVQDAYYIQKYYAQTAAGNYPTWDDILS